MVVCLWGGRRDAFHRLILYIDSSVEKNKFLDPPTDVDLESLYVMLSPVWCAKGVSESRACKDAKIPVMNLWSSKDQGQGFVPWKTKANCFDLQRSKPRGKVPSQMEMSQKVHQLFLIPCSISPENVFKIHCGAFKIFCWETISIVNEIFILLSNVVSFNEVLLQYFFGNSWTRGWLVFDPWWCNDATASSCLSVQFPHSRSQIASRCLLLQLSRQLLIAKIAKVAPHFFLGSLFDLWTPFMW